MCALYVKLGFSHAFVSGAFLLLIGMLFMNTHVAHVNAVALQQDNYDAYENAFADGASPRYAWSEVVSPILSHAAGTQETPGSDDALIAVNRSLRNVEKEPFVPQEFSGYAVRNAVEGFDVFLFDEDHLFIARAVGFPAEGVQDAFRVLAFRYFLYCDERTYVFDEVSTTVSDEMLFFALEEGPKSSWDEMGTTRTEARVLARAHVASFV